MDAVYESIVSNVAWFVRHKKTWNKEAFQSWTRKYKDFAKILTDKEGELELEEVAQLVVKIIVNAEKNNSLSADHKTIIMQYDSQIAFYGDNELEALHIKHCSGKENESQVIEAVNQTQGNVGQPILSGTALTQPRVSQSVLQSIAMNSIENLVDSEDDVENWFSNYERLTNANGWSKEEKGMKVSIWFREKALHIWNEMNSADKQNYDKVKERIISKICQDNEISSLRDFFNRVQTPSESVNDYAISVKKAFGKAFRTNQEKDPKVLLERFRSGLIPDIQESIVGTKTDDWDQIVKLASDVEKILKLKTEQYKINSVPNESGENKNYAVHKPRDFKKFISLTDIVRRRQKERPQDHRHPRKGISIIATDLNREIEI